ncbi:uncharacterized protein LOC118510497 isoform X2 [Anopheles stephensi]|uniref:uncharacterized protein LOC118510497 isoform X2 n=1 Tax=Anopheles stephensi TaxID=30069 RepID=UPI001658A049|nr:uncharacterized protein LOC118510497 isoform X2 [Anopheles stephensi]
MENISSNYSVKVKQEHDELPAIDEIKAEKFDHDITPTQSQDDKGFAAFVEYLDPARMRTQEPARNRCTWRYFLLTPEWSDPNADGGKTGETKAAPIITVMHEIELEGIEETYILHQWEEPLSPVPLNLSIEKPTRYSRWDVSPETENEPPTKKRCTRWDVPPASEDATLQATRDGGLQLDVGTTPSTADYILRYQYTNQLFNGDRAC